MKFKLIASKYLVGVGGYLFRRAGALHLVCIVGLRERLVILIPFP